MTALSATQKKEHFFLAVEHSLQGNSWVPRADRLQQGFAEQISRQYELPLFLAHVLAARDVLPENVGDALNPTLKNLMPDPATLTDMDRLVDRLKRAILKKEKIAVFGDYDVDGACSTALMVKYLRAFGLDPLFHIPDRLTEGYGPSVNIVEKFKQQQATLIIALDCGTTSFEVFDFAHKAGLDVLVIDHHLADVALPQTQGLVNPNRQDDLSSLTYLCAAGVTFMVLVALNRALREASITSLPDLLHQLDLVALATVADVVPLVGLNRAFVARGLDLMRERQNIGLRMLGDIARLYGPIEAYHLGFLLGPRINAGGRIGEASLGVQLLLTNDEAEAMQLAQKLDQLNKERQIIEQQAVEEAKQQAEHILSAHKNTAVLIAHSTHWHIGVVGLVASRLKEQYKRPCFALAGEGENYTGSARSIPGVDLGSIVREAVAKNLLIKGGGHAMAAGVTLAKDKLEAFQNFIEQACAQDVAKSQQEKLLKIDSILLPAMLTEGLWEDLQRASPFGTNYPEPVFVVPDLKLQHVQIVAEKHVRLNFTADDGSRLKCMAFRIADSDVGAELLDARGRKMHLACTLSLDQWQGRREISTKFIDVAFL